jgi:predicted nucleic acid-binding protein
MRIMIDTNVLLSALIFNSTKLAELLEHIIGTRSLVLCSYVIEESKIVIGRKTPNYL